MHSLKISILLCLIPVFQIISLIFYGISSSISVCCIQGMANTHYLCFLSEREREKLTCQSKAFGNEVSSNIQSRLQMNWCNVFNAIKILFCDAINHLQPVQRMSCVVVTQRDRESLSEVGQSSGISSSQRSVISGMTAACLCLVSKDKQQPEYNHLSHTGLLRSQSHMSSPGRQRPICIYMHICICVECVETISSNGSINRIKFLQT